MKPWEKYAAQAVQEGVEEAPQQEMKPWERYSQNLETEQQQPTGYQDVGTTTYSTTTPEEHQEQQRMLARAQRYNPKPSQGSGLYGTGDFDRLKEPQTELERAQKYNPDPSKGGGGYYGTDSNTERDKAIIEQTKGLIQDAAMNMLRNNPDMSYEDAVLKVRKEMKGDAVELAADIILTTITAGGYQAIKQSLSATEKGLKAVQAVDKSRALRGAVVGVQAGTENLVSGVAGNIAAERDAFEGWKTDVGLGMAFGGAAGMLGKSTSKEIEDAADELYKYRGQRDAALDTAAEAEKLREIRGKLGEYEKGAEAFQRNPEADIYGSRREKEIYGEEAASAKKYADETMADDLNVIKAERDAGEARYRENALADIQDIEKRRSDAIKGGADEASVNSYYDRLIGDVQKRLDTELAGVQREYDTMTSTLREGFEEKPYEGFLTDTDLDRQFGYRGMGTQQFEDLGKRVHEDQWIRGNLRDTIAGRGEGMRQSAIEKMQKGMDAQMNADMDVLRSESKARIDELKRQRTSDVNQNKQIDKEIKIENDKLNANIEALDQKYKAEIEAKKAEYEAAMPDVIKASELQAQRRVGEEAEPYRRRSFQEALESTGGARRLDEADIAKLRETMPQFDSIFQRIGRNVDDVQPLDALNTVDSPYLNRQYIDPDDISVYSDSKVRTRLGNEIRARDAQTDDVFQNKLAEKQAAIELMDTGVVGRLTTDLDMVEPRSIPGKAAQWIEKVAMMGMASDVRRYFTGRIINKRTNDAVKTLKDGASQLEQMIPLNKVATKDSMYNTASYAMKNIIQSATNKEPIHPRDFANVMRYAEENPAIREAIDTLMKTPPAFEKKVDWNVKRVIGMIFQMGAQGAIHVGTGGLTTVPTIAVPVLREISHAQRKSVLLQANDLAKLRNQVDRTTKDMKFLNSADIEKGVETMDKARAKITEIDTAVSKNENLKRFYDIVEMRSGRVMEGVQPEVSGEFARLRKQFEPLFKERARLEKLVRDKTENIVEAIEKVEKAKVDNKAAQDLLKEKLKSMSDRDARAYLTERVMKDATRVFVDTDNE